MPIIKPLMDPGRKEGFIIVHDRHGARGVPAPVLHRASTRGMTPCPPTASIAFSPCGASRSARRLPIASSSGSRVSRMSCPTRKPTATSCAAGCWRRSISPREPRALPLRPRLQGASFATSSIRGMSPWSRSTTATPTSIATTESSRSSGYGRCSTGACWERTFTWVRSSAASSPDTSSRAAAGISKPFTT